MHRRLPVPIVVFSLLTIGGGLAPESPHGAARKALGQTESVLAEEARRRMVDKEIVDAGIQNRRVIDAMRSVPRHEFVPLALRREAYLDRALPIGEGQTISPPFVVAYMTEALDPQPNDKVLEIGTGSGYQAAVLSGLVRDVYSIEIVPSLGQNAARTLKRLRYDNVHCMVGDGYLGWPEHAPFDKIIVTCSPEKVPAPLREQLKEGGKMVIPVGERYQHTLYVMTKKGDQLVEETLMPTLFVPMTGRAEASREVQPDPANPQIANGSFEKTIGDPPQLAGWHYVRQAVRVEDDAAPHQDAYVTFSNAEPGRESQMLQGFAVDGTKVLQIDVSLFVRAKNVRPGLSPLQLPALVITYYDEKRVTVGQGGIGPWRETIDWQAQSKRLPVPIRAREAIIRLDLFGAVGEVSVDDVTIQPVTR
ncbi:MAG: protein-L-isoaspartate(D-aspartate) O-methyltransferase [Planctomycetota bacterium]